MAVSSLASHAESLADLFMSAAHADHRLTQDERDYIRKMLEDLLCARPLPDAITQRMASFDPQRYDMLAAAEAMRSNPPMRPRRLLELVGYVMLADGEMSAPEDRCIKRLGEALGLQPDEYRDLTLEHESKGPRRTFTKMAVVPVPNPTSLRR